MPPIICTTAHKSVTIPLGAGLYAGGCYLSHFIPQALVAGLSNKAPTALVSLVARITTTLGRGVHVVGAIAFIVAVHQIASRCSLKHAVQSGFRHFIEADDSAQRNQAVEGLPWDLMQMLPIKDVRAMLRDEVSSFNTVMGYRVEQFLEGDDLQSNVPALRWLLSGKAEDKTKVTLDASSNTRYVGKALSIKDDEIFAAKLLTSIIDFTFQAPAEGLATTADRATFYAEQFLASDASVKPGVHLYPVLLGYSYDTLNAFIIHGASLVALKKASGKNEVYFQNLVFTLVLSKIQSASFSNELNLEGLNEAWQMVQETSVSALPDTNILWWIKPWALVQNLLKPGKEQWVLAAWLMGQAPLKPGTMEPLPFSEWTPDNCQQRIYDCWSAQDKESPLLEAKFLMAILLAKQPLPPFDSEAAAAQHRARCLNTLDMASADFDLNQLTAAKKHLYPEETKDA